MRYISALLLLSILVSCSKKDNYLNSRHKPYENDFIEVSDLQINEYAPKSSSLNEFDEKADWIELYNPTDVELIISTESWSLSDNENQPEKYFILACSIPAKGHLVIWCDGLDLIKRDFHANFKLSGHGENIGLYHNGNLIDEIVFDDEVKKNVSYGRINDGDLNWRLFESPSPGTSNQSPDNYAETIK